MSSKAQYESIDELDGIEHLRLRPGMYVGSLDDPTHLLQETVDNAVDEAAEGATRIVVRTAPDYFSVEDNGRGFPLVTSKGNDAVESAFTKLFTGGKFDANAYKSSRGLNGIGLTAVNALSTEVQVATRRKQDKKQRNYVFQNQKLCMNNESKSSEFQGTSVFAKPDPAIFVSTQVNDKRMIANCRLAVTLNQKLDIEYNGKLLKPYTEEELLDSKASDMMTPLWKVDVTDDIGQRAQIFFGYNNGVNWHPQGAVNRSRCDQGTHVNVMTFAVYDAWDGFLKGRQIERDDVHVGLALFVACDIQEPNYTSQTKEKLDIRVAQLTKLKKLATDAIIKILNKDEETRRKLLRKFEEYRKQVNRINSAQYLDQVIEYGTDEGTGVRRSSSSIDTKLIECLSTDRESTELIIVEGDSAAGPAINTRDRMRHAILPLRGKILNVVDVSIQKIMDNLEVRSMVNAIGAGAFHKQKSERIRYGKIVLAMDADADGSHIRNLVIGALCYCVPSVILEGRVYVAKSPLYGQTVKGEFVPIHDEKDIDKSKPFDRFKGLGSCDDPEIEKILFNEDTRQLIRLDFTEEDMHEVLHIVSTSMGKRDVMEMAGLLQL